MLSPIGPSPGGATRPDAQKEAKLWEAAQKLEASFLSQMLKSAGFGSPRQSFGGGAGEEQFGSFLLQAQAEIIVQNGGIGLAENLFESLKERADGQE